MVTQQPVDDTRGRLALGVVDSTNQFLGARVDDDGYWIISPTTIGENLVSSYADHSDTKDAGDGVFVLIAANALRKHVVITNDSNREFYLGFGFDPAIGPNVGHRLNRSGGIYEINNENMFRGEIRAIVASGNTKRITAMEGI